MDKYIIVTTLCNKEEIANKIINTLLEKRLVAGTQVYKAFHRQPTTGGDELVGEIGTAIEDFLNGEGRIKIAGEIWRCKQDASSSMIKRGDAVKVTAKTEGLCLIGVKE